MVSVVETVECAVCFKTHLETPPEKMTMNKDGVMVMGYDARDWSYYRDWYQGVYAVVCKKVHDKLLAPELSKLES